MQSHDRLFKLLLTTFFIEFLELFTPHLARRIDPTSLVFLDKEVFTDLSGGQRHEVDILARIRCRGQNAFFLIHVENQAQVQGHFSRRMFTYFARLHEKHRAAVYPIALFSHDRPRHEAQFCRIEFPDLKVLRFRFRVVQLRRLSWRRFIQSANPIAAALMAKMGMKKADRPRVKLECLRLLSTFRLNRAKQQLIAGFVDAYLQLNNEEALHFERQRDKILTSVERKRVMKLTTSWEEKGRKEGRRAGHQAGLRTGRRLGSRQGQTDLVLGQLTCQCGQLPDKVAKQVASLSSKKLAKLSEALLHFSLLDDLNNWLNRPCGKKKKRL